MDAKISRNGIYIHEFFPTSIELFKKVWQFSETEIFIFLSVPT